MSQGLVPRTVHTKLSEEQVAGTCPKNSNHFEFVGLVSQSLRLDIVAKKASSHDGTCARGLLQGLVVETSSIVCADLKIMLVAQPEEKARKRREGNRACRPRSPSF